VVLASGACQCACVAPWRRWGTRDRWSLAAARQTGADFVRCLCAVCAHKDTQTHRDTLLELVSARVLHTDSRADCLQTVCRLPRRLRRAKSNRK